MQNNLSKLLSQELLTSEEEILHSRNIIKYQELQAEFLDKEELSEEEKKALNKANKLYLRSKKALIESNTRLVVSIARSFMNRGLDFEDLVQEGIIGLDNATNKFKPSKGCKFSTYATYWIRQAISRAIGDKSRSIRIPVHLDTATRKIPILKKETPNISDKELAEKLGISLNVFKNIQRAGKNTVSLDKEITNNAGNSSTSLSYLIKDKKTVHPEKDLEYKMLQADLKEVLSKLPPIEEEIIKLRFGIGQEEGWTLDKIAKKVNLSRERVRQIETRVTAKLRTPVYYEKLVGYEY